MDKNLDIVVKLLIIGIQNLDALTRLIQTARTRGSGITNEELDSLRAKRIQELQTLDDAIEFEEQAGETPPPTPTPG